MIKNTPERYGIPAILLHWSMALPVIGLFPLGLYMTSLDYYHPLYQTAPWWHKSLGLLVFLLLVIRLIWRGININPYPLPTHRFRGIRLSLLVHRLLYLLLLFTCVSGYLITTADGRSIEFFNWFEVPALIGGIEQQEDVAGDIHFVLAVSIVVLTALHVAGAFKHHFIDRDETLKRIFGVGQSIVIKEKQENMK